MGNSRRDFLKQGLMGAAALGAASLTGAPVFAAHGKMPQAEPGTVPGRGTGKRLVMISLDGICSEGYVKASTPNLDALFAEGTLSLDTRVVMPSITMPNWTSHLCGCGPEVHGVTDNKWELGKFKLPAVETDADGYFPSVFKLLKDNVAGVKTAFYYNWIPLFYPFNPKYFDEVAYEDDEGYVQNYAKCLSFIEANRNDPAVIFLYSVHTDETGHRDGWMSPQYIKSIEDADVQVGWLLDRLKEDGLFDSTHFIFMTDHGGIGKGHGGLTVNEMLVPWGLVGPGIRKAAAMGEPNNTVNTAGVILHLFGVDPPLCWTTEVPASLFL